MDNSQKNSAAGSARSIGIAGAHGRLTRVTEILDQARIDAYSTPADGSNTFQGQCRAILSRWSEGPEAGFILMASFDSETASSLNENLSTPPGKNATGGTASFPMILTLVLPTT